MKALIAANDGPETERTLGAVGNWASTWGIEAHLFRVLKPSGVHDTSGERNFTHSLAPAGTPSGHALRVAEPLPVIAENRGQALTRLETEAAEELSAMAQQYLSLASTEVHVEVADDVPGAIVRKAAELGVDLIVMGTHGRTGLSHVIVGSVAEAVIRQAPQPVLVVGPRAGAS